MKKRIPEYEILDLILNRWSPRAMSGETISDSQLMSLFEAARWHHHRLIINRGGLFMQSVALLIGILCSIL